jgi:hypothetical protein
LLEKAKGGIGNGRIDFDVLEKLKDYQISFLQFETGEEVHHHDHPGMTGALPCATALFMIGLSGTGETIHEFGLSPISEPSAST